MLNSMKQFWQICFPAENRKLRRISYIKACPPHFTALNRPGENNGAGAVTPFQILLVQPTSSAARSTREWNKDKKKHATPLKARNYVLLANTVVVAPWAQYLRPSYSSASFDKCKGGCISKYYPFTMLRRNSPTTENEKNEPLCNRYEPYFFMYWRMLISNLKKQ